MRKYIFLHCCSQTAHSSAPSTRRKRSFVGYLPAPTFMDCASICVYFSRLRIDAPTFLDCALLGTVGTCMFMSTMKKSSVRVLALNRLCNLCSLGLPSATKSLCTALTSNANYYFMSILIIILSLVLEIIL